ncbi:ATP-binding cassette domain-containing protein [Nakamurella sp. YIM 132087]|uniref:ATP-binding cassette domain-containing protein n=1 Tax=Nakamurella alba TaxID=2665158 RepID=A0A7K1FHU1_9ACTN|nr:ABC transporter ATP-binding protein [Nakamurella alba]MTD13009.1 ATP-binding cassette domain-containing protein [Nakamurella alba]
MPPSTATGTTGTTAPGAPTDGTTAPVAAGGHRRWIARIWAYCWRHKVITSLAAVAGLGGVGLGALTPWLTGLAVDDATDGRTDALAPVIVALVALALVRFGSSFLRRWAGGRMSLDVQHDMRQDVFGALSRLDGAGQDALRTGQVVSRASSDLQVVQGLLAMVPLSAGQVVLFVASLVLMAFLSPLLTVMALLVVPAVWLLVRATRIVLFPATWAAQQSAAEVADIVEEDVTGVRVVKGFGQEERELRRLRTGAGRLYRDRLRAVRLTARISPGLSSVTAIGQVGVLALGGYLALRGVVSLGTFLAFSLYLAQLVAPTRTLSYLLVLAQQGRASVERVLDIIDSKASVTEPDRPERLPDGPVAVDLTAVRFGYTSDEPVLDGFDLHVPAGATVALVGASGSGKSTVSLLLPRFYDPQQGTVALAGTDIRRLSFAELRGTVGVVFEEAFLFSDTIGANIAYGRPDATAEDVRTAARAAEADEFISALPDGYDTVIGERGLTLSGGQRQRLALARAMITDPRVLLLDDATSAVDPATEAAIHATLHRLTRDRTTLLIAHRRSTLELADQVAVVVGGRVVDQGSHEDLLLRCAPYRELLGGDTGDLDGGGVELRTARPAPVDGGVTPELWPDADPADDGDPADHGARLAAAAAARVGPRMRPAGGGPGGGLMGGAVQATPELLEKVRQLPPGTDDPPERPVDEAVAAGEGRRFSFGGALRPFRALLWTALVLVALDAAAQIAIPALVRGGVDHGVSAGAMDVVWLMSGLALLVVAVDYVVQRRQLVVTGKAGEGVLYTLRTREFAHLQRLGLDFYEREMSGRIMTRMTTDVDALSTFLQTGLVTSVVSLTTFLGIAIALVVMNPGLALLAFAVLPPLFVATFYFRRFSARAYDDAREKVSAVNADLQENVSGMRITQAMRREQANAAGFAARSDDYRRSRMRAQTAISVYFPFVALLSELAAALVLGVGAERVAAGTVTAGTLIAFVLYLDSFFTPIQQLSQVFDSYQQAAVGLRRIGELLSTPTSTPVAAHPLTAPPLAGDVRAERVGFRYSTADEGASPALVDVDLEFPPGRTIAVVGPTGAGKSTLVKLIARYYDVTDGTVRVDGTDIRDFDLPSYRRRLGVVPQEPHLFAGTVRDNIAYGRPDATDAEVESAARAVGAIDAVAALSGGFRHRVDERGRNLSAGQRQLVSLARAELVDPDILLLDEATAALDPAAEAAVLAATDRLAKGRTTVVVAHRLTTASRADSIVVMDHGRVVETGTHADLLDAGGLYSRLYREDPAG